MHKVFYTFSAVHRAHRQHQVETPFLLFHPVAWLKLTDVSEVFAASIIAALMMMIALKIEAAITSETSVNFYQATGHNNPEPRT
jgi:hypothetical protein